MCAVRYRVQRKTQNTMKWNILSYRNPNPLFRLLLYLYYICLQLRNSRVHRDSIENKIALRSDDRKSNFSNNFTVLRFLVNRVVCKRIWPAEDNDDDKPTLKLETVSCPRVKIGIIGLSHFPVHDFRIFFFSRNKVPTHWKTKSEFS